MKHKNEFILPSLFFIPAIAGILFMDLASVFHYSDLPFLITFLIYVIFVLIQRAQSRLTFSIAILLLIYTGLSYIPTSASLTTERFGEWFYLFFVFGIVQYSNESWKQKSVD